MCFLTTSLLNAAGPFDADWKEVCTAIDRERPRTATNVLARIEEKAREQKVWPDYAAAVVERTRLAYTFTEESALKKEGPAGYIAQFAAEVETAPVEVRPMLRLALARNYLSLSHSQHYWHANRTQIAGDANTNQPPWSAEKLRPTLQTLLRQILADAPALQAAPVAGWRNLISLGNDFGTEVRPTLFDFVVSDFVTFVGENHLVDRTPEGAPTGLAADVLAALDQVIAFHAQDTEPPALAYAKYQRVDFLDLLTEATPQEKMQQRIAAFEALEKAYIDTTWVGALAAERVGRLRAQEADADLRALHDDYLRFGAKWPKTPGGDACLMAAHELERPSLEIDTERHWMSPWPKIEIDYKNLTRVAFRLVSVDVDDLADNGHFEFEMSGYMDGPRKYFSRKPVRTWTVDLPPHTDYRSHRHTVAVPSDLPKGHYVLFASADESFDIKKKDHVPIIQTFVTVTDLALVTDCSDGRHFGYLLHAEKGTPVANARVELWTQERRTYKRVAKTVTAADGSFTIDRPQTYGYLRAVSGKDEVLSARVSSSSASVWEPQYEHIDFVTDRALYRPGQTVKFKGFAFHLDPEKNEYHVLADRRVYVTLLDPNGQRVGGFALMSNGYGSFSGEFVTPRDRLTGGYEIVGELTAADGLGRSVRSTTLVRVEEYKRPKFSVAINPMKEEHLNAETRVTGVATTYTGLPVPQAKVEWEVRRETRYPRWWWFWRPHGEEDEAVFARGTATTDEKGAFSFTFTPTPSKKVDLAGDPSFYFSVHAVVTDGAGEAHTADGHFEVGVVPWRATVYTSGKQWNTPQDPVSLRVGLTTLNGEPVADVKGTLKVFALKGPEQVVRAPVPERGWFRRVDVHEPVKEWEAETWPAGDCVGEYAVVSPAKDEKPKGLDVKLPVGVYRAEYTVTAPNGKTVKDVCTWHVIDPTASSHAIKEPVFARVENYTVPVGGTARFYWGSGYEGTYCRVFVRRGDKKLCERQLTDGAFCFELPITADLVGGVTIETLFVRENRLYRDHASVSVPRPDSTLKITRAHMTSKLLPGAQETWSFTVSGSETNDVRAGVELLACLYDRSLDAFCGHELSLPFSQWTGLSSRYMHWNLQHRVQCLNVWNGSWPQPWDREKRFFQNLTLPRWQPGAFTLCETVGYGWRKASLRERLGGARRAPKPAVPMAALGARPEGAVMACVDACEDAPAFAAEVPAAAQAPRLEKKAKARVEGEPENETAEGEAVVPRKNLAETAFFLPHLTTDEKGAVTFTFTVPDALTGWKFTALAHDAALRGGVLRDDTLVTTKPLMVEPTAPRFVREGDCFRFPVKVTNTEETPQTGTATLAFFDAEAGTGVNLAASGSAQNNAASGSAQGMVQAFTLGPKESKTVEFAVAIPDGCGCLRFVATAKGTDFSDGEEGYLPVLSKRIEVRESLPLQIKKAGAQQTVFKELSASGASSTLRHAGLAVQVVSDPTWYAFLALPYLMEYPHACCEQVFSRFYANVLAQHIARARPAYRAVFDAWEKADAKALKSPLELNEDLKQVMLEATPWVNEAKNETRAKRHLGELFGSARLDAEQKRAVEKLEQNFNKGEDLWPWFPGGPGSAWVTMHVLTGYARLDRLVGDASLVRKAAVCKRARAGLDAWMGRSITERLAWCKRYKVPFTLSSMDLRWLYLQSFDGSTSKYKDLLLEHLRAEWRNFNIAGQSLAALVLVRGKDAKLAREIVGSLKERAVRSEEFGLYWKRSAFFDCSIFAAPVSDQALAMEAFVEVEPDDWQAYEDARLWLLEQKRTQNWSTTVSTVDAVYAILLGGNAKGTPVVAPADEDVVTVKLGGVEVPRVGVEAGTGFYEYRYAPEKISAQQGMVELARKEDKLGWASLNWTYLEEATKVKAFEQSGLRLTKTYFKKTLVEGKTRLVALNGGEVLHPGDELVSRLTIDSDRIYEYAHLRDERPATAEPEDVLSRYRWLDGLGFYQSTRDTATHYYFDRLPKGNFVLETSFRVRQQGVFASGIASLQCMYAPEFGAHSNATIIEVKR